VRDASFDDLVNQSVVEGMSKILGENTWRAINFFFDTRMAASHPDTFTRLLDRMFGLTSKVLQKSIAESLFAKVGAVTQIPNSIDLGWVMKVARGKSLNPLSLK